MQIDHFQNTAREMCQFTSTAMTSFERVDFWDKNSEILARKRPIPRLEEMSSADGEALTSRHNAHPFNPSLP